MTQPATLTQSGERQRLRTPPGLLPDARHVVLPEGITSSGAPAIIETCSSIGIALDRWQRDACYAMLAKNLTGWYAADTCLLSIGRQVGKTFLVGAIVFADSIANPGTLTVWTAHRFKVARESFDELRALAESEAMAPYVDKDAITTAAGNEVIPFRNGSRIVFAARERGSIRGFRKVRRLVLDEAQILTDAALSDLAPTQNQATNPQIILMGTPPKPSDPSEAWTRLRTEALAGEAEGVAYIEYGAAPGSDPDDRAAWAEANPSYPTRTPERALVRLRRLLDDDDFLREVMGIWTADLGRKTAIDPAKWAGLRGPTSTPQSPSFGVAVSNDRTWTSIVAAWRAPDGKVRVEVQANLEGVLGVGDKVAALRAKWGGAVVLSRTARELVADATEATPTTQALADNALADLVNAAGLSHGDQPELNKAVAASRWKGSGAPRPFDDTVATDISPLTAAALAVHAVTAEPKNRPGRFVSF